MGNSRIRRMCMDGMLVGIFVVLAKLTIKAGPIHIAFSGLTVVFATCYFGMADGLIVALLGETIIQLTSSYGIGPTTPLWLWSPSFRALILGLFDLPFRKKGDHIDLHIVFYAIASVIAGLFVTLVNAPAQHRWQSFTFAVTYPTPFAISRLRKLANHVWYTFTAAGGMRFLRSLSASHF